MKLLTLGKIVLVLFWALAWLLCILGVTIIAIGMAEAFLT